MTKEYKQFSLRLERNLYDAFIKLFPAYGLRQFFLRTVVRRAVDRAQTGNKMNLDQTVDEVLESAAMKFRVADSEVE